MSQHKSYGKGGKGETKRNVLKRFERIDLMRKRGHWKDSEDKRVTGLPKTRVDG